MAYFAPYIDESGIHMPTYEDRLEDLVSSYRSIFGIESELSPSVPDYQLLSVFAKALDDTSALVVQDFNSRNPMYASGQALDLLLPQYGIVRAAGETDAEVRARIRLSMAGRATGMDDALLAAVKATGDVWNARLYVNDTNATDANGIPAHSIAVVVDGGNNTRIARAIYNKKAPGIGTYGSTTKNVTDGQGNTHAIHFTKAEGVMITFVVWARLLPGGNQAAVEAVIKEAIPAYVEKLGIGVPLNVPQLYGAIYAANPAIANTFVVTDIQCSAPGTSGVIRDLVDCPWNDLLFCVYEGGVNVQWS